MSHIDGTRKSYSSPYRPLSPGQRGELEKPHHQLVDTYTSLNRQYVELQSEYKHLRRYFGVTAQVPYTDVWTHKPVQFYPGKHPFQTIKS